jgi:uncharacterized protein (UPF0335 family)
MGHNSEPAPGQLRAFVERAERLNEEKANISEDIAAIYAEAKGVGFDAKILRKLVALRKMDPDKRAAEAAVLDLYQAAIDKA